jgi:phosphate starvation-inducible PhoH-like protein
MPKQRGRKDIEPEIFTRNPWTGFKFKQRGFEFTQKQKQLISILEDQNTSICFILGSAGTSKTLISAYCALQLIQKNPELNILYLRSVVESSPRSMGYLPGEMDEKFAPYLAPLEDKLEELIEPGHISNLKANKIIEGFPVNFLRGANWMDKIVIMDEAQNLETKEFLTILSRLGKGSKLFICGDPMQSDIHNSGLVEVHAAFDSPEAKKHGIRTFEFTDEDIVRSPVVKFIVEEFKKIGRK